MKKTTNKKAAAPKKKAPAKAQKAKAQAKPKPKRKRRTQAQILRDKAAEQKKAQAAISKKKNLPAKSSDNKAAAISHVSKMIREGAGKPEIIKELTVRYKITDVHGVYDAAKEYIINNVFKDNVEYYANYIEELDYLYKMAIGTGVQRPDDAKDFIVDYKEARTILAQKEHAQLAVNQMLQVY